MKKTIYELLGLIKDGKAPSNIEFNLEKYYMNCEGEYIRFDAYGKLIYLSKEYKLFNCLNDEVVIIEKVKNKEYEELEELEIQHIEDTQHLIMKDIINALIRNQKKIIEALNDKDKNN